MSIKDTFQYYYQELNMKINKTFSWYPEGITFEIHPSNNVTVFNSYKVKKRKHMKEVLKVIDQYREETTLAIWYQICEWKTHNLLYELNIKRDRTKDYDINDNVSIWEKIAFVILSVFYIKF